MEKSWKYAVTDKKGAPVETGTADDAELYTKFYRARKAGHTFMCTKADEVAI